ncbi:MAG: hypothetical protein PHX37_00150 [Eubacteriales bacterium]|nr:hypothetical protein [Eubacteriales bacterium]
MKKSGKFYFIAIIAILVCFVFQAAQAATSEPGSEGDPLVSKGYVDQQLNILLEKMRTIQFQNNELTTKVAALQTSLDEIAAGGAGSSAQGYTVIEITAGQLLLAGEGGVEIILRSGQAVAISGINGDGIADITAGKSTAYDLKSGDALPQNHLLLLPRNDGRGIQASTNIFIMIRGEYTINE